MDYQNFDQAKIYKLVNTVDAKFYIGSTTRPLSVRLDSHIRYANRDDYVTPAYKHINDHVGWDNVSIELIEECEGIEDKDELRQREQYFMDLLKDDNCLNVNRAYRTQAQLEEYNEQYLLLCRQRREANPELYKQRWKNYSKTHRDELNAKDKVYREENKEYISMQKKERRHDPARQKFCEPCGTMHQSDSFARHKKSKKHLANVARFEKLKAEQEE